jgi:peptide/nickel transport system ATP-binding protein
MRSCECISGTSLKPPPPPTSSSKRPTTSYTVALLHKDPRLEARPRDYQPIKGEIPSPIDPPTGCHFHPRCPHARQRCIDERPALKEIAPKRWSACHLNDYA